MLTMHSHHLLGDPTADVPLTPPATATNSATDPSIAPPDDGYLPLEADSFFDDDGYDDTDSAYDNVSLASSTTSITSDIMRFKEENGRTYSGQKNGTYILPTDEEERDRQDLQNHLCLLTFDGRLSFAPFQNLHRVLDIGTGTGIWAINFADEHPEAQVIGVDLAPQQPLFVPPNLVFEIDDLEDDWNFTKKFDYIHSMMMTGSFENWPRFYDQAFEFLQPGGYLELQDIFFPILCDDNTMPASCALAQWSRLMLEASHLLKRPLNTCGHARQDMLAAGFVDVVEIPFRWPMNRWPKDKKYKEIGMWTQENFSMGVEAMSLALFTRGLGWSYEEVVVFAARVRADMRDGRIHAYWPVHVIYGRKP